MTSSFRVYIDESGDEGFVFLPNEQGSSRWLVLSAVVVRTERDLEMVRIAKACRELLNKPPKYPLHFRNLKHEQRVPFARMVGEAPLRHVSVLVHKPSIQEPEMFQQEKFSLYRYATRLLLERVSWLCRDHAHAGQGDGTAELIFSNRSIMSYEDLRNYLRRLARPEETEVRIHWPSVDIEGVRAVNHDQLAGLQIADAVATSVFYAVHRNPYGETEDRYLRLLARNLYRHRGTATGYGLKFWCDDEAERLRVLAAIERA
ncbi:DUF3800 domain-containing protein [Burkholderia pseudomallei]|uniref:DUF3800 domain-containing protein n=1 Tax=Burkholderia pseudomallei TaxID=28450 RepID=A0A0C5B4M5_BURPE|nr:DUF3800 domain-containing protein [Burkholderia pseudomallei]AJL35001.1 hypothetical protein pBPS118 [Burkholderia pseudomallei]